MKKIKQKIVAFTTVMALGVCGVGSIVQFNKSSVVEVQAAETTGLGVDYHSQSQIASYINAHSSAMNFDVTYKETPSTSEPYSAGELSQSTQNRAVELLNIIRYVAGIPYNVTIDSNYAVYAQTGALVNAVNNQLSHFPTKPADMSQDLYDIGYKGTSSSNIAMGYTLCGAIKNGWMSDADRSNIPMVGHRRWCLNPTMGKTAFGAVNRYTSMYAFDRSNTAGSSYSKVAWPAQNTPISLFSSYDPWSISMGKSVDADTVQVTLKCINNGNTYSFNSSNADGDFYVNNGGYGQTGCIIFRPDDGTFCNERYSYSVNIIGNYNSGDSFNVSYNVNFFDTDDISGQWIKSNGKWWYRYSDGGYPTGWALIDSKWYLFDKNGWMLTKWQYTGKKWYYLGGDGAMRTGWQELNGKWYYLESSGAMSTGWKKIDGKWYYLKSDGTMKIGWLEDGGKWYYLRGDGTMHIGWKELGGKWYYLESDGAMATGWKNINGKSYYLEPSGEWNPNK